MPAYAPRSRSQISPRALAVVIGIHAAGLAVLLTFQPELVFPEDYKPTVITDIAVDPQPLPPPPPSPQPKADPAPTVLTNPAPVQPLPPITGMTSQTTLVEAPPITPYVGTGTIVAPDPGPPLVEIRSSEASLLTSPDRARPPYPESKRRMGDEAVLSLQLTIGADGRVTSVEPLGDVDRAFLRSARRHILKVWRYAPATEGGEAVESVKTIRLRFLLDS